MGDHVGGGAASRHLLLEAAEDRRAAGAEQLDLDALLLLEQRDNLLRLFDRGRRVPDHLALGLGLGGIDRILRMGRGEREKRRGADDEF